MPLTSRAYVTATATGAALNLAVGTLIGGSSIFSTGSPSASALTTGTPAISHAGLAGLFQTGSVNTVNTPV